MRLQVFLSHNGVCSRREGLRVVQDGHVMVNGKLITEPSFQVDPDQDRVLVDGKPIKVQQTTYIMLNKPKGYVTTKEDPFADKTVLDLLPKSFQHLVPVGRLDKDTEGLLLLTNDGDVAYKLTHPKFNVNKTYYVRIQGRLGDEAKLKLEKGVVIEGEKTAPAKIFDVKWRAQETECKITIHEGKKRQIRIMFSLMGHKVTYLCRLKQGPLKLGNLPAGEHRRLREDEIENLKKI